MSEEQEKDTPGISRRKFVTTVAATGAALTIVPRHVLGRGFQAPSDTLNIATVGINGQGFTNTRNLMGENIVAICDVDYTLLDSALARAKAAAGAPGTGGSGQQRRANPSQAQLEANARRPATNVSENTRKFVDQQMPKLKRYKDYREMLDKQKDIDARRRRDARSHARARSRRRRWISASTSTCRSRCAGRCRKRVISRRRRRTTKVVTQMGNQGHSTDDARHRPGVHRGRRDRRHQRNSRLDEPSARLLAAGRSAPGAAAAGEPERPLRWNSHGVEARLAAALGGNYPVPDGLSWDLFLGVAPEVDYHPLYHPFNWRGWVDWGQGALGDMGAHLIDHPFWGLKLGMPTTIETISTPFNGVVLPDRDDDLLRVRRRAAAMPAVKMTWYDGGFMPPQAGGNRRREAERRRRHPLHRHQGQDAAGHLRAHPRLLPSRCTTRYGAPKQKLARVPTRSTR